MSNSSEEIFQSRKDKALASQASINTAEVSLLQDILKSRDALVEKTPEVDTTINDIFRGIRKAFKKDIDRKLINKFIDSFDKDRIFVIKDDKYESVANSFAGVTKPDILPTGGKIHFDSRAIFIRESHANLAIIGEEICHDFSFFISESNNRTIDLLKKRRMSRKQSAVFNAKSNSNFITSDSFYYSMASEQIAKAFLFRVIGALDLDINEVYTHPEDRKHNKMSAEKGEQRIKALGWDNIRSRNWITENEEDYFLDLTPVEKHTVALQQQKHLALPLHQSKNQFGKF